MPSSEVFLILENAMIQKFEVSKTDTFADVIIVWQS